MDFHIALIIVSFASLVKGVTGFGFALVALPLLLFYYDPITIIPVLVICNLFSSVVIVLQKRDYPRLGKKLDHMIIYGAVFASFGALILTNVSASMFKNALGIIFMIMTLIGLFSPKRVRTYSITTYKVVGAIVGLLTSSVSVSAPPLALFLQFAGVDSKQFRITFAWFNVLTAPVAIIAYAIAGLIDVQMLKLVVCFLPILYLGTYLGKRLNAFMPESIFRAAILIIMLISCVILLIH